MSYLRRHLKEHLTRERNIIFRIPHVFSYWRRLFKPVLQLSRWPKYLNENSLSLSPKQVRWHFDKSFPFKPLDFTVLLNFSEQSLPLETKGIYSGQKIVFLVFGDFSTQIYGTSANISEMLISGAKTFS